MSRRTKWIAFSIGIVVILLGGLLVALKLTSPAAKPLPAVQEKDIPVDWVSEQPSRVPEPDETSPREPETETDAAAPSVITDTPPFETTGTLTFLSGDKPFGTESYSIDSDADGTNLKSSGEFRFKVVLATISVSFEQTLKTDMDDHPTQYSLDFRAPFGLGQNIQVQLSGNLATVVKNDDQMEIPLSPRPVFTVGTFSTYALIPIFFASSPELGNRTYDLLTFGGPPSTQSTNKGLGTISVKRDGTSALQAGDISVSVDRYLVSGDLGMGYLYARGKEFLAFSAQGDEDGKSLLVYRIDFFPEGIEIVK
jgi:hypothetical protein